jgi:hypothetical protein
VWPAESPLRHLTAGEQVVLPEIPRSFDGAEPLEAYLECVDAAIDDYVAAGVIRAAHGQRLTRNALRAYLESR